MKHFLLLLSQSIALASALATQAPTLIVGGVVEAPKKLQAPTPGYPPVARQAGVEGLILLAVTLNEDGRPADIQVLRGIPLLDLAAIEAVRRWRYEPTIVNGVPRRVQLVEVVEFFLDDGSRIRSYAGLALDKRQLSTSRLYAISQLVQVPPKRYKAVAQTLQQLSKDNDQAVAGAAEAGLAKLAGK